MDKTPTSWEVSRKAGNDGSDEVWVKRKEHRNGISKDQLSTYPDRTQTPFPKFMQNEVTQGRFLKRAEIRMVSETAEFDKYLTVNKRGECREAAVGRRRRGDSGESFWMDMNPVPHLRHPTLRTIWGQKVTTSCYGMHTQESDGHHLHQRRIRSRSHEGGE